MKMPFTTEQFFEIFEKYNTGIFPLQFIFIAVGLLCIILLKRRVKEASRVTGLFVGFIWLWMGFVYHFGYFSSINKAAYFFGFLFIIQGVLFILTKHKLELSFTNDSKGNLALFFMFSGVIFYPLAGILLGQNWAETISLGLPCPTTIFTFGVFIMAIRKIPFYLMVIPSLWSVMGISAALNFGVHQDFFMMVAAMTSIIVRFFTYRKLPVQWENV